MSKTESNSRVGEDVSPAHALNTAIAGFMSDFKDFSHGMNAKLQKQDDRMNKLDRKTMITARTALAQSAHEDAPHQKAFAAYLRSVRLDSTRVELLERIAGEPYRKLILLFPGKTIFLGILRNHEGSNEFWNITFGFKSEMFFRGKVPEVVYLMST